RSLDTMDLTLHLEKAGAFAGRPPIRRYSLDALCDMFGVLPHDRHTASGDAFITAQVFLRLLRLASRHGRATLGRLSEPFLEPATVNGWSTRSLAPGISITTCGPRVFGRITTRTSCRWTTCPFRVRAKTRSYAPMKPTPGDQTKRPVEDVSVEPTGSS